MATLKTLAAVDFGTQTDMSEVICIKHGLDFIFINFLSKLSIVKYEFTEMTVNLCTHTHTQGKTSLVYFSLK